MRIGGTPSDAARSLLEEWTPLGDVTAKPMFGGIGVFCDGVMFTILDKKGSVFLRSDESTDPIFEAAGSHRHGMPYWLVPDHVLTDPDELLIWARRALAVARANRK